MQNLLLLFVTIVTSFGLHAQNKIEYKVLEDNPDNVKENFLYLYYFDYENGFLNNPDKRHDATESMGSSVDWWQNFNGFIANANLKIGYFGEASAFKALHLKVDGGTALKLGEKTAPKGVKMNVRKFTTVVAVEDNLGNAKGFARAIGMEQIEVNRTVKKSNYLRGGLAFQSGTYRRGSDIGGYSSFGVYLGFVQESRVSVLAEILQRTGYSAQYMRMYCDAFFYPVLSTSVSNEGAKLPFGFRAGMQGSLPGMNNFFNWMLPKIEFGFHGLHGTYFQIGLGVDLYNF